MRRIAAYAPAGSASFDTSSILESYVEHDAAARTEAPPQRSAGEEVDAILQTARNSAAKLIEAATREADRTLSDAKAVATRELEQARRGAETEREEAERLRADAETHAAAVRNDAETAAEKLRAQADEIATSLIEAARAKVAATDKEVEKRLQAAEEAGTRVSVLQAEAKRHEERLAQLSALFHETSLRIEAVLEGETDGHDLEPAEKDRATEH